MRFSTEPKCRKYVMVCCHLQKKLGDKYGKISMDTATKTRIDAAKTARKE